MKKIRVFFKRRQVKHKQKNIMSSLDWMDVKELNDDHIILERDGSIEHVYGIKIEPHPIFLDSKDNQTIKKNQLRNIWNRFKLNLFHGFVFNPINLDIHYADLNEQYYHFENDEIMQEMILDDMAKAEAFQRSYMELEFFVMIKGKPSKRFDKVRDHFFHEFKRSNIKHKRLNKLDFTNYITNKYENPIINDLFHSQGIFSDDLEVAYEELISSE